RDLLLGRPPADFDVATDAHPQQVLALFGQRYAIPTGLQHGTVTVVTEGDGVASVGDKVEDTGAEEAGLSESEAKRRRRNVEVTTFRGEGAYVDGRRPSSVTYVGSLQEDLSRRDFTMNAIGYDPIADVLSDPFEGRRDLAERRVRAVGDAETRFREDGLRPMRAIRQATQLGFEIDPPTLAAISPTLDVFRKVSAERIRDEMLKMLLAPRPSGGIELMRQTGMLVDVLPELLESVGVTQNRFHKHDVYEHTLAVVDATAGDAITRLGALLHDIGKPRARQPREGAPGEFSFFKHEYVGASMTEEICRRWKLSNADRDRVVALVHHHMFFYTPDWTDGTVRRFVRKVGPQVLPALFALREGDIIGRGRNEDPETELGELRRRIAAVEVEDAAMNVGQLAINGSDVMRILGRGPGREIGVLLERLLEKVLDDPRLNTSAELERLLREIG
ncbi:MAG: HDIG domain-containing protein, partial [Deltaproteobacteria bacterium]|nr:HDIG domain-containing protein [Deltaproteobacteria bacterium]